MAEQNVEFDENNDDISLADNQTRVFLVDYENVKTQGLNGIVKLTENDTVCIFYSENADSMTFGLHRRLMETKANVQYQKVEVGYKNALDFQLSSYLGYVISQNKSNGITDCLYYIVTKDQGFLCLKNYWHRRHANVYQVADVTGNCEVTSEKKETATTEKKETTKKQEVKPKETKAAPKDPMVAKVEALLKDKGDVEFAVKCINHYKTKSGVNNGLTKHYKDSKKASEVYNAIKPLIADKKGK